MKKLKCLLLPLVAFILVACGHATKKEFISLIEAYNQNTNMSLAFDISLQDVQEKATTQNANVATQALVTMLEASNLSVEVHTNQEAKAATIAVKLDGGNSQFAPTIDMHVLNDQVYMNGSLFKVLASLQDPEASNVFNAVEGHYVNISELGALTGQDTSFINATNLFQNTNNNEKAHTIYEYLDASSFSEENGVLTATITRDQYKKIVQEHLVSEHISFAEFEKYADDMTIVTKINKQTKEVVVNVALDLNDSAPLPLDKATIVLNMHQVDYVAPKILTDEEILTLEEFQQALVQNFKLSDTQFDDLYNSMKENIESVSEEMKQKYLSENEHLFTESQLKKLKELFFSNQQ